MRSEELRLHVNEDLGRMIRRRALQLGVYPADYARVMLAQAVEKDLRTDISAAHLLDGKERKD